MPFVSWAPTSPTFGTVTVGGDINVVGHVNDTGLTPVVGAGGQAGGGAPAPNVPTGTNDDSGIIGFGTGTTPAAGTMVTVTFAKPWVVPGGGAPHIVLSAANAATAALGLFPSGISPTGFNVSSQNAPAASQGTTVYQFCYQVRG